MCKDDPIIIPGQMPQMNYDDVEHYDNLGTNILDADYDLDPSGSKETNAGDEEGESAEGEGEKKKNKMASSFTLKGYNLNQTQSAHMKSARHQSKHHRIFQNGVSIPTPSQKAILDQMGLADKNTKVLLVSKEEIERQQNLLQNQNNIGQHSISQDTNSNRRFSRHINPATNTNFKKPKIVNIKLPRSQYNEVKSSANPEAKLQEILAQRQNH